MIPESYTNGLPGRNWDLLQFNPKDYNEYEKMEEDVISIFRYLAFDHSRISELWLFKYDPASENGLRALESLKEANSFILQVTRVFIKLYSSPKAAQRISMAKMMRDFDIPQARTAQDVAFLELLLNVLPKMSSISTEGLDEFMPPNRFQTNRKNSSKEEAAAYDNYTRYKGPGKASLPLIIGIALFIVLALIAYFLVISPKLKYDKALNLIENGEYLQASEILSDLGDYEDSAEQLAMISEKAELSKLSLLSAGDTVTFGSFEQDGVTTNGIEPLEWIVLDEDSNGRKLIITKNSISAMKFDENNNFVKWSESAPRKWLNGEFIAEAFTENEKKILSAQQVDNGTDDPTIDIAYLISSTEATAYAELISNSTPTEAAKSTPGCYATSFWSRTITNYRYEDYCVLNQESASSFSGSASELHFIRPLIWIDPANPTSADARYSKAVKLYESGQFARSYGIFLTAAETRNAKEYIEKLPKIIATDGFRQAEIGSDVQFGEIRYDSEVYKVLWTVLHKEGGRALVISKHTLGSADYHSYTLADPGWKDCTLREFLKEDFAENIFSPLQVSCVLQSTTQNPANPRYGTPAYSSATDYFFILNHQDIERFMPGPAMRKAYYYKDTTKACEWWVNTPGERGGTACLVNSSGELDYEGHSVFNLGSDPYYRVAMWIDISK